MGLLNIISFIINHPISKHSKVRSLCRFFWWQIRSAFTSNVYEHQFTQHSKLLLNKGMKGATGNLYCGLQEFEEMMFLVHFLKKDEIFIDVGANIGSYTILASAEIGAISYSFEPIERTFIQLQDNVVVNGISDKANIYNIGLSSKAGELYFSDENDTALNHVLNENDLSKNKKRVEVYTLDSRLIGLNPSLIKIDVEGFELEVLKGASETLNKTSLKAIIIELNGSSLNYGFNDQDIHNLLLSIGFESFTYKPFERALIPANLNDIDNLIYVRDLNYVKNKLISSPKYKILNIEI